MTNRDSQFINRLKYGFKLEVVIGVILNGLLYSLTYLFKGIDGVMSLLESMGDSFESHSLIITVLTCLIGLFFLVVAKRTSPVNKIFIRDTGAGLYDVGITLMRLVGGGLLGFSLLHLFVDGWKNILIVFVIYSIIAGFNATFLSEFKKILTSNPNRELKSR